MLKQISEKQVIDFYKIAFCLFIRILGNLHCFINHHGPLITWLQNNNFFRKKGNFPVKVFRKQLMVQ